MCRNCLILNWTISSPRKMNQKVGQMMTKKMTSLQIFSQQLLKLVIQSGKWY